MSTFITRLLSAIVYAALFIGSMYSCQLTGNEMIGTAIFAVFILFVAEGCTFEYYRIVEKKGSKPVRWYGYLATLAIVLTLCFLRFKYLVAIMPPIVVGAILVRLWGKSDNPFDDISHTIFPTLYAAIPLGMMPMLHQEWNIMMMILLLIWLNDSGAYIIGSLLGKHKLWQRHSPGKTWEGCVGGLAVSIAAAVFVGPMFETNLSLTPVLWAAIAVLCSVIGTLGDLAESMLKRSAGVKDSGTIMPGHGGFLDRFDSLLAVIPCVVFFIKLIF